MTFQGELAAIYMCAEKGAALHAVNSAEVRTGRGLVGDRYFFPDGTPDPGKEITLIESEALAALAKDYKIELDPNQSRRSLLTRGVPLNHLVGKDFKLGSVRLRGIRLCEPCAHLEKLTMEGVRNGLIHRGGLRAQILDGGTIRVGDRIVPLAG